MYPFHLNTHTHTHITVLLNWLIFPEPLQFLPVPKKKPQGINLVVLFVHTRWPSCNLANSFEARKTVKLQCSMLEHCSFTGRVPFHQPTRVKAVKAQSSEVYKIFYKYCMQQIQLSMQFLAIRCTGRVKKVAPYNFRLYFRLG